MSPIWPLLLLLISACSPPGMVLEERLPAISLDIPCLLDTGDCDGIVLHDVPYQQHGTADFSITNTGSSVLQVELGLLRPEFQVEPDQEDLASDETIDFTVSYVPQSFQPLTDVLSIEHNASDHVMTVTVSGSTDPDGDDDGHDHEASEAGDDCNDTNASVYPGADDQCYDGLDQDCDGWSDFDCDQDGFDSAIYGGDDCDDSDPSINPGALEIPGDGVDQNCDDADD